jgi:tetratricopeptide (TPR) repeat protein
LLNKLGRDKEAADIMTKYLPLANMNEIHQYARQLLQLGKKKEALQVFQTNYDKNPNQFTTLMGLTRGYSAVGDYQNALKYANLALAVVPAGQKTFLEAAIKNWKKERI